MLPLLMRKTFQFGVEGLTPKIHLPLFVSTCPCVSIALCSVLRHQVGLIG